MAIDLNQTKAEERNQQEDCEVRLEEGDNDNNAQRRAYFHIESSNTLEGRQQPSREAHDSPIS